LSDEALMPMTNSIIYWVTWRSGVQKANILGEMGGLHINLPQRFRYCHESPPFAILYFYGPYCRRRGFVYMFEM